MIIYPASWNILQKILSKHNTKWHEVEEIFVGNVRICKILSKDQYNETRYKALGSTFSGRYLTVIFVKDDDKNIKVISTRPMTSAEKKQLKSKGSK